MRQVIILLSILFSMVSEGYARNFYLDPGGNDENDGSRLHPWRTPEAVGRVRLEAGDSVFLRGGQVFHGMLRIGEGSGGGAGRGGSAGRWVWIGSYGGGLATIAAGDSAAVVLDGVEWVTVSGLRLVGAGRKDGNIKDGLDLVDCHHVRVSGVDITGFQKSGLLIYSSTDVVIERVFAHENGAAGIAVEGSAGKRESRNLKILYCRTDDNPGDPTNLTNHSGNGIVAGHCTGLLIDHCSATNNGWDMPRIGNGPVGIWCYEADSVIIQHCLAYRNKT
jgi:hypothetical protein